MVSHFLWCEIFISYCGWGLEGSAMATNITYILNWILSDIILYRHKDFKQTAVRFDRTALAYWADYLKIGVPGACMLCFEWWAFEFLAIFSGYMGVASLAAEVVIINIVTFVFMMPLGVSFAASSLTGNYIGANQIKLAKKFGNLTIVMNMLLTLVVLGLMIVFSDFIANLFTNDPEIVALTKDATWAMIFYIFFDGIHGVQAGIIRGLGKQNWASVFTLVCYYVFGMPLALWFGFKSDMGVSGLWLGFAIASVILDLGFYFIIRCTNWARVAYDMTKRMDKEEEVKKEIMKALYMPNKMES